VQDDVLVCSDFASELVEAVVERPGAILSLYTGLHPELTAIRVRQAWERGDRWEHHHGGWVPAVALVWPRSYAMHAVGWIDEQHHWVERYADDARIGHYVRWARLPVWHRVPSLVDHTGLAESLIGSKAGPHQRSVAPPRAAAPTQGRG
jgi:hypothetical protein